MQEGQLFICYFTKMTTQDIALYRLLNQHIAKPLKTTPAAVVANLGALQAQDYLGVLWSIGLRLQNATEKTITNALVDRSIIRTWLMRGTLHFVPAVDAHWMLKLTTPRILAGSKKRHEQLDIDEKLFKRCMLLFIKALQGGNILTRKELMDLLEKEKIATGNQRGYHLLWYAAQTGLICFGPIKEKQQTFVLLDEWVQHPTKLDRDEALTELTKRYFTSHGPATVQDFAGWSSLTMSEVKLGIEYAKKYLHQETINEKVYWMGQYLPHKKNISGTYSLLPGFDEYILGYKDRSVVLAPEHFQKIVPGSNGMFMPTLVSNGQIIGTWKRNLKKTRVEIQLFPFRPLTRSEQEGIEVAINHYGSFLELPMSIA